MCRKQVKVGLVVNILSKIPFFNCHLTKIKLGAQILDKDTNIPYMHIMLTLNEVRIVFSFSKLVNYQLYKRPNRSHYYDPKKTKLSIIFVVISKRLNNVH